MVSEDYEKLTVVELKKLIKQRGLSASGARKADLVKCLQEDEGSDNEDSSTSKNKKRPLDEDESEAPKSKKVKQNKGKGKAKSKGKGKKEKEEEEEEDEEEEDDGEEDSDEVKTTTRTSGRVKAQKAETQQKEATVGQWDQEGSVYYLSSSSLVHSSKIASFDMDDTLIETKSGKTFAQSRGDWQWLYPDIPTKLKELNKQGVKVVIFTNQAGITSQGFNKGKLSQIEGKIEDLIAEVGFPIQSFIASADDQYRKPATAMWDLMVKKFNGGLIPDKDESIFVGDAAGRAAGWQANRKKDFSCSDRKFAKNIGIKFSTPEEYFKGEASAAFEWGSFDIASIPTAGEGEITEGGEKTLTSTSQEMVLFVGFPASGLAKRYMVPAGYTHVNRDTLKTQDKCLKAASESIAAGKSVVVDNTNPDRATRATYIAIAKKADIPVRCFRFEIDEKLANHLNYFRERLNISKHVPRMGYAMYKKKFEEPSLAEGFAELKKIQFVKHFDNKDHEAVFDQAA